MNPRESGKPLTTVCWHQILSKLSFSCAHLHSLRVLKFVPQITDMPLLLLMILCFIGYVNLGHKVLKCARKQFTDSIINISPEVMPTTAVLSARRRLAAESRRLALTQWELMCCSVAHSRFLLVTAQAPSCFYSVALLSLGSRSSLVLLRSMGDRTRGGFVRHGIWWLVHIESVAWLSQP